MALAVSNIIRSIYVLVMVPIWGFATATNTLVSFLIGQKRHEEVFSLILKIATLCFIGVLILVSIGLTFPRLILEIYTNNNSLIEMGIPTLYVVSVGALLLSVGFIFHSAVAGTGKTNISLIIEMTVLTLYVTYTYVIIIVFGTSVTGAWTSEIIYGSFLSLLSLIYLKSNKWLETDI